jgi:uncharacterized membrane protein YheB (UPF0754 family)
MCAPSQLGEDFKLTDVLSVSELRERVDGLLGEKLELLTPDHVKSLVEDVIRRHLHWLIIWGNVFGAVIGLVSQAAGFGV